MSPASNRNDSTPVWLGVLVLADLLLFPRLTQLYNIPASLPLVAFHAFTKRNDYQRLLLFTLTCAVLVSSAAYGAGPGENIAAAEGFKRAIQLSTMLLYGFLSFTTPEILKPTSRLLRVFFLSQIVTVSAFYLLPDTYLFVCSVLYPEALDEIQSNLYYLRYPYVFSDPNSAGYLLCFAMALYHRIGDRTTWIYLCTTIGSAAILTTQSRGAYIGLLLVLATAAASSKASRLHKAILACAVLAVIAYLVIQYIDYLLPAAEIFLSRFGQEDDLGGGRIGKYLLFLENLNFYPIGSGYHLWFDGSEFRPHSDLIRLNLSYGILAAPLLLYFIVPRSRSQIPLFVIFLIPFLINSAIDDYRLLPLYLVACAIVLQLHSDRHIGHSPT